MAGEGWPWAGSDATTGFGMGAGPDVGDGFGQVPDGQGMGSSWPWEGVPQGFQSHEGIPQGLDPSVAGLPVRDLGENGWCVPRRLVWTDRIPVAKSPTGAWMDVVGSSTGRPSYAIFVMTDDGTFATYILDDPDCLRVAYDVDEENGEQPYVTSKQMPVGKPFVILHLPVR